MNNMNDSAGNKDVAKNNHAKNDHAKNDHTKNDHTENDHIVENGDIDGNRNINACLVHLRACRRKLKSVDDDELNSLDQARQVEWARDLQEVSVAITSLQTAELVALSEEFIEKSPELCAAASRLEEDLQNLDRAAQVICAVSDGLKEITNMVGIVQRMKGGTLPRA